MSTARAKSRRHFLAFIERHREYQKIYRKYAEVADEFTRINSVLSLKQEDDITDEDVEDFAYYDEYCKMLALMIADHALMKSGYSKNKEGYWL